MWLCVHEDRTDRQRQTDKPRIFKLMFPVQNISTVPGDKEGGFEGRGARTKPYYAPGG